MTNIMYGCWPPFTPQSRCTKNYSQEGLAFMWSFPLCVGCLAHPGGEAVPAACLPVTFSLSRNDTESPLVRCHPLAMQGDAGKLWKKLTDAVATLSWADAPV